MIAYGATAGVALGVGLTLIVAWFRARKPRLADRIAPYVRGPAEQEFARESLVVTPFPKVERLLAPVLRDGVRAVERWGSPTAELRSRLERAGSSRTVEQFRTEQVLWAIGGAVAGIAASVVLAATRGSSPIILLVLILASGLSGAFARDAILSREIRRRQARIVAELPTVAELLALSVSAGEGALGALERVAKATHGVMADELTQTLGDARTGSSLMQALEGLGARTGVPALRRFADGIATAVERGTPLADVMRAQAQDVRAEGRRALMEEGGKREIAMLVPVVFLILPVTVVFAVYPGLVALRFGG